MSRSNQNNNNSGNANPCKYFIDWKNGSFMYYDKEAGKNVDLGDKIKIEDTYFDVVGVMEKIGSPPDDAGIMLIDTAMEEIYEDVKVIKTSKKLFARLFELFQIPMGTIAKNRGLRTFNFRV